MNEVTKNTERLLKHKAVDLAPVRGQVPDSYGQTPRRRKVLLCPVRGQVPGMHIEENFWQVGHRPFAKARNTGTGFCFVEKGIELQAEMLAAQFFCKFLHFDLVGKNYFTIFAGGKGIKKTKRTPSTRFNKS